MAVLKGWTIADRAGAGVLVGCRVRFLAEDVPSLVPRGTVGVVMSVRSYEPKATVEFVRPELGDRNPWRCVHLETAFRHLELVEA